MVNWKGQGEIAKDSDAFVKLILALFGFYVWELLMTWDFEWSLITGRRKFKWPLVIFFFLCRYSILWAFIGLIISVSVRTEVNCAALYTFNSFAGNMSILTASTSLMIRTIALWERKLIITVPLLVLCLGHWVLLWRGMFIVEAAWEPSVNTCAVVKTNDMLLKAGFFYTMAFDFVTLVATTAALMKTSTRSGLWHLLFKDGLVFFLASFTTNSLSAILNTLDLNTVMNVIATVPAAAVSCVAACRAVIRLQDFSHADVYVHSSSNAAPPTPTTPSRSMFGVVSKSHHHTATRPEVHVTTDHITMAEFSPSLACPWEEKQCRRDGERDSLDLGTPRSAKYTESSDEYSNAV